MEEPIQYDIKCPAFLETDAVIKNIIAKFEKANSKEKQYYAQDILLEIRSLLLCSNYNATDTDCLNCHYILYEYLKKYK